MDEWNAVTARNEQVDAEKCLWCKNHVPGTEYLTLETGERICIECVGDLREFKRSRHIDFLVSAALRSSVQTALLAEWQDVQTALARWHRDDPTLHMLPARESNAYGRSQSDE